MNVHRELHPVERALDSTELVPRDGVVVVAVSGGADSMALVEALRRRLAPSGRFDAISAARYQMSRARTMSGGANPKAHGESRLVVAHFDHQLREDSARDAEHVAAYARAHGIEFAPGCGDVARRARAERVSLEEAARDARYDFLAEAARQVGAACVVTGHTRSDHVETILMQIVRGAGRFGAAGIPERRGPFVRPLLGVERADTRDYCATHGVAFVDDPTNDDARFFRNRMRHEILPELRAAVPSIDEKLLRIAERARREHVLFAQRTAGWMERYVRQEVSGAWAIRRSGFDEVDDDDATALLREVLVRAGCARDVGRVHYARLLDLVRCNHAGAAADLPRYSARREHDAIVIEPSGGCDGSPPPQSLGIPGRAVAGDWTIDADFVSADEARAAITRGVGPDEAYFDAGAISAPLLARAPRAGDRMRPFGLDGHKKLSDLFVDRKMPRRHRARAVVIEGDVIHWVPGLARSEEGRIGLNTTRVLRLKATRA